MTRHSDDAPNNEPVGSRDEQRPTMAPGDQAPPGTPGTGENVCRRCGGSGRTDTGVGPECHGSGKVIEGIGGA